jgi:hypothetical protein
VLLVSVPLADGDDEPVPVTDGDEEPVAEELPLDELVCVADVDGVSVPLTLTDAVSEPEALTEAVHDALTDGVVERVELAERVPVRLSVGVEDVVGGEETDAEGETVELMEAALLREPVGVTVLERVTSGLGGRISVLTGGSATPYSTVLAGAVCSSVEAPAAVSYRHSCVRLVAYRMNCPPSRRPASERAPTLPAKRPADSGRTDHDSATMSNAHACTVTLLSAASFASHTFAGVSKTKPYEA